MIPTLLGLLLVVVILSYVWIKKRFRYWKDRGFMQADNIVFPYGNMKETGQTEHMAETAGRFYKKYKNCGDPIVGFFLSLSPVILALDLDVIQNMLVKEFSTFHDRGFYFNLKDDPLSGTLFAIEGQDWREARSKYSQSMTLSKIKMMFNTVLNISNGMIAILENPNRSKEFDMKQLSVQVTTDVIANVALGLDTNCMKNPDNVFMNICRKVIYLTPFKIAKILFMTGFGELSRALGLRFFTKEVSDFFMSNIRETINYRQQNNIIRPDFLNSMMQFKKAAENDINNVKSEEALFGDLAAQCAFIFMAGYETSSSALAFCFYELALRDDVQNKLRIEIKNVLERHENKLTYECLFEMKYLQMVIDETLRMHPPIDHLMRISQQDYKVPNRDLIIPKGTVVVVPAFGIQYDPEFFPDPYKFDPERFSDENKKKRHPMTFLSFGEGPRSCVGMNFAYMEMKIVLIQLLSKYKFSPSSKTDIPIKYGISNISLTPNNGVFLNVEKILDF